MMRVMGRRATGRIDEYTWKDGSGNVSFYLRVPAPEGRRSVDLGTVRNGWTREQADAKLIEVMALLKAGMTFDEIFPPPPVDAVDDGAVTIASVAERHIENMRADAGLTGADPDTRTIENWRWALNHLLPTLGPLAPAGITIDHVDGLRRHLVKERAILQKRAKTDHPIMVERSRSDGAKWQQRAKPLSDSSINRVIDKLATLLDIAMEDPRVGLFVNPARGKRRKLTVKTPTTRTYLEPEQVVVLLDAAKAYEKKTQASHGSQSAPIAPIVGCLVMGGQRISEACETEKVSVNLGARVMRAGGKTAAGMGREIDLVFDVLIDLLGEHLASHPGGKLLFPTINGTPRDPNRVRKTLAGVVDIAEGLALKRGVPPLGTITPHALRRTNISLLSAAGYDPGWIMQQVGHTDPKLTLRIYNQVLKRKRSEEFRSRANELLGARTVGMVTPAAATPATVPAEWSNA
jgi:integrase